MTLRLDYHFHTPSLLAHRSVLGQAFTVVVDGREATIRLPRDWPFRRGNDAFDLAGDSMFDHGFDDEERAGAPEGVVEVFVTTVAVEARVDVDLGAMERGDELYSRHSRLLASQVDEARRVARSFVHWATILSDQAHALGDESGPYVLSAVAVDVARGRRIPGGYGEVPRSRDHEGPRGFLTSSSLASISDVIGSRPPTAETLLRMAEAELGRPDRGAAATAILFAGAACETKMKQSLVAGASDDWRTVVRDSARRPAKGLATLYGDLSAAVFGSSMVADEAGLYARLQALASARNDVAHGKTDVTSEQARVHVASAREVFSWIDGARGGAAPSRPAEPQSSDDAG